MQNVKAENDAIGVLLSSFSPNPIRKSSSSVYANICEVNYGQSKADMLSKFEIALKECSETEGCYGYYSIQMTLTKKFIKKHRNLCGRIRRMLIASCRTLKENVK